MTLSQSGNQVTGTYTHDSGKITGTVSGDTLTAWWSEYPSYGPPNDAGSVELTMGSEHQTLTGRWRYGSSGSWYENDWTGTRKGLLKGGLESGSSAPSSCDWTGTWDFDWSHALKLTQSGNRVTGSYKPSGWNYTGYIDGTLSGSTLNGTWIENDQTGKLEWNMAADCNSFTGRYTHSLSANSGWYLLHEPATRASAPQPQPQPVPQPVTSGWGGTWNTDWGTMIISVAATQGSGTYTTNNGKLVGTISGNNFNGTWSRSPSYKAPRDAGSFALVMSPDGNSFKGDWKYSDCSWAGPWDGTLNGPDITPSPSPYPAPSPSPQPTPLPPSPTPNPTPGLNRPPLASFYSSPQLPEAGTTVSFISQSSDPDGDQLSYTWTRDGSTLNDCANQPICNWYNASAGTHAVTLIANDGKGGRSTFQAQVNVSAGPGPSPSPTPVPVPPTPTPTPTPVPGANNAPNAAFTFNPPQPQVGQNVQVISQSTDADGDSLIYSWYLDGQQLSQQAGQAVWKWKVPSGGHVMQLEVKDGRGGRDTVSRKIKGADTDAKKKWKIGPFSCFIATAAYGSETAEELDTLRAFRDKVLLKSEAGRWCVASYYRLSPPLAEYIAGHEGLRKFVRERLLDPLVDMLKGTRPAWDTPADAPRP
jgi:hypothetical protein